jgi:hypothetical protein
MVNNNILLYNIIFYYILFYYIYNMPSPRRSSSSRKRSAATRIQKRVRGKQTRKRHSRSIKQIYANLEKTNECAICQDPMTKDEAITRLGCTHRFHAECLQRSLRSGHASCPLCRTVIPNNAHAHLANQTMTYEQALNNRNQALEERRLATQALTNAQSRTNNYERSNRNRRLRGVNSPTHIRLLEVEEEASAALDAARERVTNSMRIISSLAN